LWLNFLINSLEWRYIVTHGQLKENLYIQENIIRLGLVWFMVFNATFNNILVISWQIKQRKLKSTNLYDFTLAVKYKETLKVQAGIDKLPIEIK